MENPTSLIILLALVGLCVGSFLNVVIYRLPIMLRHAAGQTLSDSPEDGISQSSPYNLLRPRSQCPHCQRQIPIWHNLPLLSYCLLRGKCAYCRDKISMRYPLVELLSALLVVFHYVHFGMGASFVAATLLTWGLLTLSVIDIQTQLLPDTITIPFVWIGLLFSLKPVFATPSQAILGASIGYLSLWSIAWLFKKIRGIEGMGYGDFKLTALLGAWLGWQMLPMIIVFASTLGVIISLVLIGIKRLRYDTPIPFGPFLAFAGWLTMLYGPTLFIHLQR